MFKQLVHKDIDIQAAVWYTDEQNTVWVGLST